MKLSNKIKSKDYIPPLLNIVTLDEEDILTTSNEVGVQWDDTWNAGWGDWQN